MKEKNIKKIKLDFDQLSEWTDPTQDDIPICSFIGFYKACGITAQVEKYVKKNPEFKVCAVDNILCNFYTMKHIKNFIQNNWEIHELSIDDNNHPFWNTSRYPKGATHYPKKVRALIRNSINTDFANYCPGLDDELEDDVLVFRVYLPEEERGKKEETKNEQI